MMIPSELVERTLLKMEDQALQYDAAALGFLSADSIELAKSRVARAAGIRDALEIWHREYKIWKKRED